MNRNLIFPSKIPIIDGKIRYYNEVFSFDIETSNFYSNDNEKVSLPYLFCLTIGYRPYLGRTIEEFKELCDLITDFYITSLKNRIIIFVHNLSFEFQFIKDYFEWEEVFTVDSRRVLYAVTTSGLEFRCTYLLSGYSLDNLGKYNDTKFKKQVGLLDYRLIRHPKTKLTKDEIKYQIYDCFVVVEYVKKLIKKYGSITKIARTKTGFVRLYCRERLLKSGSRYYFIIRDLTLTLSDYYDLKLAFAGGFTHANAKHVGKTLLNIGSFDYNSSYPASLIQFKYPMTSFKRFDVTESSFYDCLKKYACLFKVRFENIRSRIDQDNYISKSKCIDIKHYIVNNGRVVEADELLIQVTEIDYILISMFYTWDRMTVYDFKIAKKDYLPKEFIEIVLDLYIDKTKLKDVDGRETEYLNAKENFNSLYGMAVTDVLKDRNTYQNGGWMKTAIDPQKEISIYNKSRNRFLFYAWGVWNTAYSRYNLLTVISKIGNDYVYSDTDSIKLLNTEKHRHIIDDYNNTIHNRMLVMCNHYDISPNKLKPKNSKGIEKPIGLLKYEGCYKKFKTLGAKRYIVLDENNKLSITIAGVNKKAGLEYLKWKFKTSDNIFKNFNDRLVFPAYYEDEEEIKNGSGKLTLTYIDVMRKGAIIDYRGVPYNYIIKSGVHMENAEYSLNLSDEFIEWLTALSLSHVVGG